MCVRDRMCVNKLSTDFTTTKIVLEPESSLDSLEMQINRPHEHGCRRFVEFDYSVVVTPWREKQNNSQFTGKKSSRDRRGEDPVRIESTVKTGRGH
jgi:hypothetical protein